MNPNEGLSNKQNKPQRSITPTDFGVLFMKDGVAIEIMQYQS